MKNILLFLVFSLFLTGCFDKTIEDQKAECIAQGKKFSTKKVFIMRTGEYEIRGVCK